MENLDKSHEMRIDVIEQKLNMLFSKMEYIDYINFIKQDRYIACYDHILAYIDLHVYPSHLKRMLKDDLLDIVDKNVTNKLKELSY